MPISAVELRHILHANPEISFKEFQTTGVLVENITKLKNFNETAKIMRPLETGLVVEYKINDGPFFIFRADIDALGIKEETGSSFSSLNGAMHACGHDIHTAVLYGFLKEAVENKISRNCIFVFQPGEETDGGADKILKTGILASYNIEAAYALHVTDEYDSGEIASSPGVLFASALEVDIEFMGISAHIAFPQNGKNAMNAMRLFLDHIDTIPKDISNPFVFGIGKISAGSVRNIIPAGAKLEGSIRSLSSEKSMKYYENLKTALDGIKTMTGVDYKIKTGAFYPEVVCNGHLFDKCIPVISNKFKFIECGYKMTGEDFGYFSKKYPALMFWLGSHDPKYGRYGLHNPKFFPGDEIIETGIRLLKEIAAL
ncbi:MAG: amidohydrolase [Candidatus Wallbacteria bacterium]